ncbi:MAG: DUF4091 domain-containing protein [Elusimicrobia bacterium]|nr:DUF4091 domain-containing protein [Elusimicrobiota bacterium]
MSALALAALLCCISPSPSNAAVRALWAVNDGEKIDRDDLSNAGKAANSAWDGRKIKLFGARNEIVSFQVIVESDEKGVSRLWASLPVLALRNGTEKIVYGAPVSDPSLYAGRPIQVFSENYMRVSSATNAPWIYRAGSPSAPKNPTGWKPVQLVPENARPGTGGFPLSVAPRANAAIWLDVYLGRGLPAGVYEGSVRIDADGEKTDLPVELELFDFALPDRNTMDAMIFYDDSQVLLYHGRDRERQYRRFAHRQRVELVGGGTQESVRRALDRYRGGDFSRAQGYAGPGEGVGDRIAPASFYGPGDCCIDRLKTRGFADAWMSFLDKTLPGAITFLYMPDEPRPADFPLIRRIADDIHSDPGPGRGLPILATTAYRKELEDAVDIWVSPPGEFDVSRALSERGRGRRTWVYNGGRPAGGSIVIDAPATEARATIWACFKHDIKVYFYWNAVHWRHNGEKPGEKIQDVWAEPVTFDTRRSTDSSDGGSFANGDGVLMYPGEERLHPAQDRGVAGPCSTLQLANLRRGLQDHAYLTLARERGLSALVDEVLRAVVPRVFSDAGTSLGFSQNGNDYEAARYRLAKAIAGLRPEGTPQLAAPAPRRQVEHPRQ